MNLLLRFGKAVQPRDEHPNLHEETQDIHS
jgi:hypothetical protein